MRVIFKLLLAIPLIFGLNTKAEIVTRYTDGAATARTEAEAKLLAVIDAAGRAFGVNVNAQIQSSNAEIVINETGEQLELYLQSINRNISQALQVPTNTPITGYSVNDISQQPDGQWRAEVTIEYAWYKPTGAENDRRSMIVMATDNEIGKQVSKAVQQGLVNERRFNILERDLSALFNAEKSFIQSVDADHAQIARLGRGSGADYIVSVSVGNAYTSQYEPRTIEVSKEVYYVSTVDFDYHIKVVEFASRNVKLVLSGSHNREVRSNTEDGKVLSLLNQFGIHIAQQITSAIYPMRLEIQQGGTAFVNRGIGVLATGQNLNVYQIGKQLIDPDSGESLDALEIYVGMAEVLEVKPKYALVEMLDGAHLVENKSYIVRFLRNDDLNSESAKMEKLRRDTANRKKEIFLNNVD